MANKSLTSVEFLRNRLRYDPDTGKLFSKPRDKEVFTNTHHSGYKKGAFDNKTYTAHRIAMAIATGDWPKGEVDHINGDKADNRLCNLRVVTKSENQRNAKQRTDNTSGITGVSVRKSGKFQAFINAHNQRTYLGSFTRLEDAISARKEAEKRLGFTERHGT